jgi:CBS domain-containing protein
MRVDELMTDATCCSERTTVRQCAELMRDANIGFVPICNDSGAPIGAVTDRDLTIRVLAHGRSAEEPLSAFMNTEVVSCSIGADLEEATRLMREHRVSRIMVCGDQDGRLRGVISLADLAEAASEEEAGETLQEVKSDQPPATH